MLKKDDKKGMAKFILVGQKWKAEGVGKGGKKEKWFMWRNGKFYFV